VCGADDPLAAAGNTPLKRGTLQVALSMTAVSATAESDDEAGVSESLLRQQLTPALTWTPLPRFALSGSLPLLRNDFSAGGPGLETEAVTLAGPGDAEVGARYFVMDSIDWGAPSRRSLALSLGTALPTGSDHAEREGERLDEHAQLGRGAFGPYAGALFAYGRGPWSFSASVNGRTFTENRFGYRYGSALLWSASVGLVAWNALVFELGTNDRVAAHDRRDDTEQENTGGLVLHATPAIGARVVAGLWYRASVQIPIYRRLNGEQTLGPTYWQTLRLSL
jgi:hypothetical protein